jgi:hypothetical protein
MEGGPPWVKDCPTFDPQMVGAAGFEPATLRPPKTAENKPVSQSPNDEKRRRKTRTGQSTGQKPVGVEVPLSPPGIRSEANHDPIDAALADALTKATAAGEWSAVELLTRELTARREARARVDSLEAERAKRGRSG